MSHVILNFIYLYTIAIELYSQNLFCIINWHLLHILINYTNFWGRVWESDTSKWIPGKIVAVIWLATTRGGICIFSDTASLASSLNNSLQNSTFWAHSSFFCQCPSGTLALRLLAPLCPAPPPYIFSWDEHRSSSSTN